MASISMAIFRSNPRRTHVLLSSPPFVPRLSSPVSVRPKRCLVFSSKQVQAIVVKFDPVILRSVLFIGFSVISTAFSKAIQIYSTGKIVGDAIHGLKELPKQFSKFRLEGNSVAKSLLKAFFERGENPADANVSLLNEVKILNMRLQSLSELQACLLKKADSPTDSPIDSPIVSEINV